MTVLIAGASGFIGSALIEQYRGPGRLRLCLHRSPLQVPVPENAEVVYADLSQRSECERVLSGVDVVVQAAGGVGSAALPGSRALQSVVENLVLTARVLEAAQANGVSKVLVFGSTTGYPPLPHPVQEDEFWTADPAPAYWGYGWMRRYLERLGEYVSQVGPTRVILVRPSAVYGPRDNFDPATCQVVPALIHKALQGMDPFEIWGQGSEVRDFLYVDDLARGCWQALECLQGPRPVNLGSGIPTSIEELGRSVCAACGHQPGAFQFRSDRPAPLATRRLNVERARRELGWQAQVSLQEGLKRTVAWYRQVQTR